jgi:tripartite-type tricarboxylate transporter receptor subunit TctC
MVSGVARRALFAFACVVLANGPTQAQPDYPSRPVRIIVPSEPGGGTDTSARVLAERLSQSTGQNFIVENRPGAGQLIGIDQVSRAPNDGYTLLVAASTITILPSTNPNTRYDLLRDFAPISLLITVPSVLVVNPALPINSAKEFIAAVKAKPGEYNFGSAGVGTQPHMAMELFRDMAGLDMQHIPYKGVAPAMTDIIAGRVSSMMVNVLSAKSQIDAGKLRGLAISGSARSSAVPNMPTVAEAALPGYEAIQWFGLFAPAGTPAVILARLHKETAAALKSPEMQRRMTADGADAVGNTPDEFSTQIKAELEKWSRVAKAAKIGQ